ncbi:MAG: hypothetical protein Q8K02_10420, partial [Flavobacterium sp.]|nr:hypothetical protein [Flavobacterium sp.]
MNFDWTDLKSILVSVAGSILFAVVVYVFYGYWKERTDKQKEQKKLAEEAATKKSQEDFEFEKIRQQLQEAEKLYNNGLFDQSLQRCKTILNTTNVQKHPGLYWCTKMKEGESYFELRIVDKYEENCLHSIDSFLACIESSKLLHDDLAEGLTYLSLGKSLAAMSSIRSKEQNLQKAIDYYKQSLQLFESSDSDVMIR